MASSVNDGNGNVTDSTLANTTYTVSSTGVVKLNTTASVANGALRTDTVTVKALDATGHYSLINGTAQYDKTGSGGGGQTPPIVLDLNGDGVQLVALASSTAYFDMDNDGVREQTGWVDANDGLLVFDRNANGTIDNVDEISFARDVNGAATDLEGLRAYDTNHNGFFDAGDAQFASFQVWQDVNQDGVSQADELKSLTSAGVSMINLTLTLTGDSRVNAQDNLIYGTTVYVRSDGSTRRLEMCS